MTASACELSIIIPVAPEELSHAQLLSDLKNVPTSVERVVVLASSPDHVEVQKLSTLSPSLRVVQSRPGRAIQLNAGAHAASGTHLWFLHADSRIATGAYESLVEGIAKAPDALHYFDLEFLDDGPRRVRVNARGAWVRSHILGIPFGDQGFCLSKVLFERLNGYPEGIRYGEDHLLVWRARQTGVRLRCTGARISTSARKYRDQGWARTTVDHFVKTVVQAAPEAIRWMTLQVGSWASGGHRAPSRASKKVIRS